MPWGRLDDRANSDAKLLALSDAAWRMWGCGIVYCQFNLTDGFIPDHAIHTFGVRAKNKEAVAEELCRSLVPGKGPLWHRVEGGYHVHDFLDWNESREKVEVERSSSKDRWQRWKQRGGKRKDKRVSNGVARGEANDPATELHVPHPHDRSEDLERSTRARGRVFAGERLKVSRKQQQVVLDELGAAAASLDLLTLYARWDVELVESGEVFDVLPYLKRRVVEVVDARRAVAAGRQPSDEWSEECKRLHGGTCEGQMRHHTQKLIDAGKATDGTLAGHDRRRA